MSGLVGALIAVGIFAGLWSAFGGGGSGPTDVSDDVDVRLVNCFEVDEYGDQRALLRAVNRNDSEARQVYVELIYLDADGVQLEETNAGTTLGAGRTATLDASFSAPAGTDDCELIEVSVYPG